MSPFESRDFRLARANRGFWAGGFALIAVGIAGYFLETARPAMAPGALPLMLMLVGPPLGIILLAYAWIQNPSPRLVPTVVRFDGQRLCIEGFENGVPRTRLRAGLVVRHDDASFAVRLEGAWPRPVELVTAEQATAETLLAALDLDVSRNRARFPLASTQIPPILGAAVYVAFAIGVLMLASSMVPFTVTYVAVTTILLAMLRWPARVEVGSDGLTIRDLRGRRFIPHERIEFVYRFGGLHDHRQGVELLLTGGTKVQLASRHGFTSEITSDRTSRLLQRVVDARARWRGALFHLSALLDATDREPRAWVRALRESLVAGHPHRSLHVDADELWGVLEDPAADPAARGGAAVALGARTDPAGRQRIRITARATADDDVRRALELAAEAEAEEEALAEALTPLLRPSR